MKSYKLFKKPPKEPQIGDYVIGEYANEKEDYLTEFLSTHIGKITYIEGDWTSFTSFIVKYDMTTKEEDMEMFRKHLGTGVLIFYRDEIKFFSKNKEDLEIYINANKYNL